MACSIRQILVLAAEEGLPEKMFIIYFRDRWKVVLEVIINFVREDFSYTGFNIGFLIRRRFNTTNAPFVVAIST